MDELRLAVEPVPEEVDRGFEVQIFINGNEMTRAGAGLGMDTNDILLPTNKFRPLDEPHQVAVARCDCGVYGCGSTDILITRENDVVHWDWLIEKPMNRRVTFDAAHYLKEIERFEGDRSWETPERVAVRLITQHHDVELLAQNGLSLGWASDYHKDQTLFQLSLNLNQKYQVFLLFPWNGRPPRQLATHILKHLETDPRTWDARWLASRREHQSQPPAIAGDGWSQESFW